MPGQRHVDGNVKERFLFQKCLIIKVLYELVTKAEILFYIINNTPGHSELSTAARPKRYSQCDKLDDLVMESRGLREWMHLVE